MRRYSGFVCLKGVCSFFQAIDEVSDLEVCSVAKEARATLLAAVSVNKQVARRPRAPSMGSEQARVEQGLRAALQSSLPEEVAVAASAGVGDAVIGFVAKMLTHCVDYYTPLVDLDNLGETSTADIWRHVVANIPMDTWKDCSVPYISSILLPERDSKPSAEEADASAPVAAAAAAGENAPTAAPEEEDDDEPAVIDEESESDSGSSAGKGLSSSSSSGRAVEVARAFRRLALGGIPDAQDDSGSDDSNLCNIKFSLAFGGKTLLYNTHLRLGRGRRYGVMGKNGTGEGIYASLLFFTIYDG
jgi:hypothetical protein